MQYTTEEVRVLGDLAQRTILSLQAMPQPIVRVCGPLTTGGFGYERNAKRLADAERILVEKGYTVFAFGDAEESIKDKGYAHSAVMGLFHRPVLESGLISEAFFLQGWNESKGATMEREMCGKIGRIAVTDFPEEWFGLHDRVTDQG